MEKLASNWSIAEPYRYLAGVIVLSLGIRVGLTVLRSVMSTHKANGSAQTFFDIAWYNFRGFQPQGTGGHSDYLYTLILGSIELSVFPILIAAGAWEAIGAWIGLKTVAQWSVWTENRTVFNLFLIGNAVSIIVSALVLTPLVTVT